MGSLAGSPAFLGNFSGVFLIFLIIRRFRLISEWGSLKYNCPSTFPPSIDTAFSASFNSSVNFSDL